MTYTTEQLIQILDQELRANLKGERIVLSSAQRLNDPVVYMAMDLKKVSKVFAYQDFRRQIHAYQREHNVSGIVPNVCSFQGKSIRFPEIHNQLVPVVGDKEILIAAKESILNFWEEATEEMSYFIPNNGKIYQKTTSDRYIKVSREFVAELLRETEWAEIDAALTDVYLGLCWGDPQECQYQWAYPHSGCHRIIAATNEPSPIKV